MKKSKQQRKASIALTDVAKPSQTTNEDKSYLKCFAVPGLSQAQVMAKIGGVQGELGSYNAISNGVLERVKNCRDDSTEIEMILHSQIAMLNSLAAHFMIKALGGYDESTVLQAFPQLPSEFANLSLKCQDEMRKCIALLHEIKNPKKPSQFIKTYVNQQLNQLQTEQQELKQRLEATNNAPVEFGSTRETTTADTAMETVVGIDRTNNPNR